MSKLTIDQKRLESLRRQLYGKEKGTTFKSVKSSAGKSSLTSSQPKSPTPTISPTFRPSNDTTLNTNYLKKDLLKVLILSLSAIAIQLALFLTPLKNLLNIKVF